MRFGVLGPLTVWNADGDAVPVPGLKVRALLASLLVHNGQPVTSDRLIGYLWGDHPPDNAPGALSAKVSQLRRVLEDAEPGSRSLVVSPPPGYRLKAALDADRFEALTQQARESDDSATRVALLDEALGLWRGPAFADFSDEPFALVPIARLAELRLTAVDERARARLDIGLHTAVADELGQVLAEHPLRERTRGLLMLALYRSGRQSEALRSFDDLRRQLADELGLDPGPELAALHRSILAQDPTLLPIPNQHIPTTPAPQDPAAPVQQNPTAPAERDPTDPARQNPTNPAHQTLMTLAEQTPANSANQNSPAAETAATMTATVAATMTEDDGTPVESRRTSNLPAILTDLVGRTEAVTEVRGLVRENRLVSLVGAGGVGKTRLALAVAAPLVEAFPDGVWLIELAGFVGLIASGDVGATPDLVDSIADHILAVLEVRDGPDASASSLERAGRALRDRRALLLLDNCEHLIDAVADLTGTLLRASAGSHVLTTSQEALGLPGEVVWSVPPLDVPAPDADGTALARSGAVSLFMARAAAVSRGFSLTPDNADNIAVLCRRLDGIPLALELAATRVRSLGVRGLVAGLDDRFRLLATGHRGTPPRQKTLLAMIDWSWELLSQPERVVLRRLAVHSDGCTLEGAVAVCQANDAPEHEVPDLVARLVERSLVVMSEGPDGPRYRLLESVAAYGTDRMREAGELRTIRRRHYMYYTRFVERAEPHLYGSDQRRWLHRLDGEAANLRTALDGSVHDHEIELALRLANGLTWFWFLRGRLAEARKSLHAAVSAHAADAASRHLDADGHEISDDHEKGEHGHGRSSAELSRAGIHAARATAWHTGISFLLGDVADWPARHHAALRLFDAHAELKQDELRQDELEQEKDELKPDHGGTAEENQCRLIQARAEWFLAYAELDLGDVPATESLLAGALSTFRELDDDWGIAATLAVRAKSAHVKSDAVALRRDSADSAARFERLGDHWGLLQATEWLAAHAGLTGDHDQAINILRPGLRMAEELGLWLDLAGRLSWLGWIAMQQGDYPAAVRYCTEGLRLATEQHAPLSIVFAQLGLGFASRRAGDLTGAEELFERILAGVTPQDEAGQALYVPSVLIELAYIHELRGDASRAWCGHAEALDIAERLGAALDTAQALAGLAGAAGLAGRGNAAATLLGAADAVRSAIQMPLTASEQVDQSRTRAAAHALATPFDAAYAHGGQLTPRQAFDQVDKP